MPLYVVATPIGNAGDITRRAVEVLALASTVIGEERKEVSKLLKSLGLVGKNLELLNEHSRPEDLAPLVELCAQGDVALVSDCGTPGFCDPGAPLVAACRGRGIPVHPVPGASSLMAFLSGCGRPVREFYFRGFLPARTEDRLQALKDLRKAPRPVILMDTPYRLGRLLEDLKQFFPEARCTLGLNLTQPEERFLTERAEALLKALDGQKAEFLLLLE